MALSQAEISLIVEEIAALAGRSTLQKVLEPAERRLVWRLRSSGSTQFLLISTERDATRLHFLEDRPDQPGHPSSFAMLLRKWLHGAPLESVRQINDDRIVEFGFSVVDPRIERDGPSASPERTEAFVVCELAGRVGNVCLLDDERRLVGQQTNEAIASREFRRGEPWTPPPPPPDPDVGSEVRWDLASLDLDSGARSRAVAEHYSSRLRQRRRDRLVQHIESGLERQLERLERRIEHIEEDLENVEKADEYRKRAELLQSAYGDIERGAESVEVPDYYRDGMPTLEIELDPRKTLQENIDHYHHEATRYEKARDMVEERLLETIDLRDEVRETLEHLDPDELPPAPEQLESLVEQWREDELLPDERNSSDSSNRSDRGDSRPYRRFRASSGRRILVGKGASQNDTLTTKVARGRDIWLHARDWAGAHVVLRIHDTGESPDREDLLDAATLAAHFSKGRNDTVVEVGYTRAKHVRKTGNLPPGRVFVSNEKTIAVELEDDRLERLLDSEKR